MEFLTQYGLAGASLCREDAFLPETKKYQCNSCNQMQNAQGTKHKAILNCKFLMPREPWTVNCKLIIRNVQANGSSQLSSPAKLFADARHQPAAKSRIGWPSKKSRIYYPWYNMNTMIQNHVQKSQSGAYTHFKTFQVRTHVNPKHSSPATYKAKLDKHLVID